MYRITTYPMSKLSIQNFDAVALREHKAVQGQSCLVGRLEEVETLAQLVELAAQVPITPSVLEQCRRAGRNFIETNIIVLDIDSHYDIKEAKQILDDAQIQYALYTSYSHRTFDVDKFHIILPTSQMITSIGDFKATYTHASKILFNSSNDTQTCSPSNLFFNSNPQTCTIFVNETGKKIEVKREGKIAPRTTTPTATAKSTNIKLSSRTLNFLTFGADNGKWHQEMILAIANMVSFGMSKDEVTERLEKITGELSSADRYQIDYGFKNSTFVYDTRAMTMEELHPLRVAYTSDKGKFLPIPAQEIIGTFVKEYYLVISITDQFYLSGIATPSDVVVEHIRDFSERHLKTQLTKSIIESVLGKMKFEAKQLRFNELKEYIKFTSASFNFEDLLIAVTGKADPIEVGIMKHFLWQVKRKMWEQPVENHIMPVFVGKSGCGKSHAISRMLSPIKDITYMDGDFKKLVDSRESFALIHNFVYFMDEMSKADKADVETIKNKITSPIIQYRKLGTNANETGPNNATFIGASNLDLEYVIKDTTSVRRFYQLTTLDKMNWEAINSFDFLQMWRSIDEARDITYIKEFWDDLVIAQQKFKTKSLVELFLLEDAPGLNSEGVGEKIQQLKLYTRFDEYRNASGYQFKMSRHAFYGELRRAVGSPKRGEVGGIFSEYYCLPKYESRNN